MLFLSITEVNKIQKHTPTIVFDEIHKYGKWQLFLKGFFDTYKNTQIIVTGSARLNIYKKSGDSLMGRYFFFRMHPLSVREIINPVFTTKEFIPPKKISDSEFNSLLEYGGLPEPFIKKNNRFFNQWQRLRTEQLFKEDLREITQVQEIDSMMFLAKILEKQACQLTNLSNISRKVNVSVDTVKRWIAILENVYYCFRIRPWKKNVIRSLLKEPKTYLWDWSLIKEPGFRFENFIASHLLKAVHYWTDIGLGNYGLYFLRNKEKKEVDFLVTRNEKPWILVEAKLSEKENLSPELSYYQKMLSAPYAFQVVQNLDYINKNAFNINHPVIIPAKTFLSQLV